MVLLNKINKTLKDNKTFNKYNKMLIGKSKPNHKIRLNLDGNY